jgi:hypothetical protein
MTVSEILAYLDARIESELRVEANLTHGARPTSGQRAMLATLQSVRDEITREHEVKL